MRTMSKIMTAVVLYGAFPLSTWAGAARTSATAGSRGWGPGTAAATANYDGNGIGFTNTRAESGRVNFARGLSVGFDEDGLSVSSSYAVAPELGPAVGGNLNLHVGLDGRGSVSGGRVVSEGDPSRSVTVGGEAGQYHRGSPYAVSQASGRTGPRGEVRARTFSRSRDDDRSRVAGHRISRRTAGVRIGR